MQNTEIVNEITNLKSTSSDTNITVSVKDSNYIRIDLMSDENNIYDSKDFERIIKNSELLIRRSRCYDVIKSTLINVYGLTYCMYYKNITFDVEKLEMHHGPIFNLYDLCEIAATILLKNKQPLTVFRIKRLVLTWHLENKVQLMMLSKNVHEAAHIKSNKENPSLKPMFLDHRSAFGDIMSFIQQNHLYFTFKHVSKIKKYLDVYEENIRDEDNDSKFFKEVLKKWNIN